MQREFLERIDALAKRIDVLERKIDRIANGLFPYHNLSSSEFEEEENDEEE